MNLKDCRESYYYNSGKASDISRNLGFAGLALIWAFRVAEGAGEAAIPNDLRWAGVFLVGGLTLDFLQYIGATLVWGAYHRIKEKRGTREDEDFLAPRQINYYGLVFFWLKALAILVACILLVRSMFSSFWK
jgi:hypothetical protein